MLNFIIPVRHHLNIKDPEVQKHNLSKTLLSLANQSVNNYKIIIVANHGTLFPPLPEQCEICYVDFPPNANHDRNNQTDEEFYDNVHNDIARRVHAGVIFSGSKGFFMKVDDDDFVHKDIAKLCLENPNTDGWRITKGYMWSENSKFLYYLDNFNNRCGSCNILKAELLEIPNQVELEVSEHIRDVLGYHNRIEKVFSDKLEIHDVEFPAAIYRVGHSNNHSEHPNFWQLYFRNRAIHTKPIEFITKLIKLRYLTNAKRKCFFTK